MKFAECNTDNHLVRVKLRLNSTPAGIVNRGVKCRRFDVENLRVGIEEEVAGDEEESVKRKYLQGVPERVENDWCDDAGVEEKWPEVKNALVHTAEDVLGRAGRLQPDWFRE